MKNLRSIITALLCFAMVFNPVLFEAALWAEDGKNKEIAASEEATDEAVDKTDEAYQTLLKTKKAKTDDDMDGDAKAQVRDANANLDAAKGEVKESKDNVGAAQGEVKAVGATVNGDGNTFEKMTKTAAGVQKVLIKTGQMLQKVGQTLKTVGQALQAIGKVLSAIPWTAAIGQALERVGQVLYQVGSALDSIGKVIEEIGQTAADSDMNFGDMLGKVFEAGKDGWKKGGEEAEAYSQKLDDELKSADTSEDMGGASEDTGSEADDGSGVVEDAAQEGVADI